MDRDPEQRIADLERQLAEQKRSAGLPPASPDRSAAPRRFEATGRGRSTPRVVICVTSDGLTVDNRPGDVFSLSEAKLCLWMHGRSTMGTALHLQCGSHRFVLGGWNHRVASGTRLEAPSHKTPHAWMSASDFDELLSMVAPRMGLDIPQPAPGEPIRCWLSVSPKPWKMTLEMVRGEDPYSPLAIDVGQDAIWVVDPDKGEVIASAGLAQVTATPAAFTSAGKFDTNTGNTMPILVVRVPGLHPLTIGCEELTDSRLRFWWCGKVPWEKMPDYTVGATDWLTLVEKFGLAGYLEDQATSGSGPQPVPWSGPIPTPAKRDRRWLAYLPLVIMMLACALGCFYLSATRFHEYRVGTPTTATVTECSTGKNSTCVGGWNVGGVSQGGELPKAPVGSKVDVHVSNGKAYTATWWLKSFAGGVGFLVLSIVIFVFIRSRTGKRVGKR